MNDSVLTAPSIEYSVLSPMLIVFAAAVLGVERIVLLDFRDSGMTGDPAPGTLAAAPFTSAFSSAATPIACCSPSMLQPREWAWAFFTFHGGSLRIRASSPRLLVFSEATRAAVLVMNSAPSANWWLNASAAAR